VALPEPRPGLVIRYAYLWRDEASRGRDEGSKDRPCVVVLSVRNRGGDRVVTVAPITHATPRADGKAVEIPTLTKQRLGLDDLPSWIVTNDLNEFVWPGPDIRPIPRKPPPGTFACGLIPAGLYNTVRQRIIEHIRQHNLQLVRRDDR
jgi:hypothetical protein